MEGGRAKEERKEEGRGEENHRKGGGERSLRGFIRNRRSGWEEDKGHPKTQGCRIDGDLDENPEMCVGANG